MTNNGKPRPLPVIVGERLRLFREIKGLRQEDVADAARNHGLSWGRSSIAALEGGNRDIRLDELVPLRAVIASLGGWDEPFLPPEERIILNERTSIRAGALGTLFDQLCMPSDNEPPTPELNEELELGTLENTPAIDDFERSQEVARGIVVYDLMFYTFWPRGDFSVSRSLSRLGEMTYRVAEKLTRPDGREVDPYMVVVFAEGMWGHHVGDERDARTSKRGKYDSKRALQSARGHVTRELIEELQQEIDARWPQMKAIFDSLEAVIDDESALNEWTQNAHAVERKVKYGMDDKVIREALASIRKKPGILRRAKRGKD
ncbi:helix-turn-helix domain-containing protein [Streptomyces sp. NPDC021218]|uniref:helix-turn-helix domain-containing protein n=1 Tax=Streptomyces sp. NPDC021218 TaxID=3365119 RepID=UPI0037B5B603